VFAFEFFEVSSAVSVYRALQAALEVADGSFPLIVAWRKPLRKGEGQDTS
jgi:hypothetical protein